MPSPQITIARKSGAAALAQRIAGITKLAAYVGVPASSAADRSAQLLAMAGPAGKKKKARLTKAAQSDVTNAELLFIFSKGSPLHNQPPRAVIEPAIKAEGNKEPIAKEMGASVKASLDGNHEGAVKHMKRAAMYGKNAAKGWFTDPRNNWPKLADSTKRARMRRMTKAQLKEVAELGDAAFTPGIDTGGMRNAIDGITREE